MGTMAPDAIYVHLDATNLDDIKITRVDPSDDYIRSHDNLFLEGRIDHAFNEADRKALGTIRVFDYTPDGNADWPE